MIRGLRAVIGANARLMVDYNQSLTVSEAIERTRALDHEDLYWIEEPTTADDFAGHARIAEAAATPVQLGENWWDRAIWPRASRPAPPTMSCSTS